MAITVLLSTDPAIATGQRVKKVCINILEAAYVKFSNAVKWVY